MEPMERVWDNQHSCSGPCEGCPGCDSPYPLGFGSVKSKIMMIGMEPAYNIDEDHAADLRWTWARVQLMKDRMDSQNPLWKHMCVVAEAADTHPEFLYFTNLSKCSTGDFDVRVDHCRPYLVDEIITVDPELLLLYGGKVISSVFEMFSLKQPNTIGAVQGDVFEKAGRKLMPLYHWGYAYRQGNVDEYDQIVAESVRKALT